MILLHPRSTLTDPLFPSTTLCRSGHLADVERAADECDAPSARVQEVLDGEPAAGDAVHRDRREPPVAAEAVDEHRGDAALAQRSEEHTSELQSLMRISYAVFCLKKKKKKSKICITKNTTATN